MPPRKRVVVLVLAIPGLVAPFLPFAYNVVPFEVVFSKDSFLGFFRLLAVPAFLAIPIAAWQARRFFASRLSDLEVALAYTLSTATMLLVLREVWTPFPPGPVGGLAGLGIAFCYGFAGANVLLLMRNLGKGITREVAAESFLLGSYFPDAAFWLIWLSDSDLQIGALVVLVACLVYLTTIILLLRGEEKGGDDPWGRFREILDRSSRVNNALLHNNESGMSLGLGHNPQPTPGTTVGVLKNQTRSLTPRAPEGRFNFTTAAPLVMALLWAGCTRAELGEIRMSPTGFEPHDAVTIVFSRDFLLGGGGVKDEIFGCISKAIHEAHPTLRIVSPDEFYRTAFPDLDPEAAPHSAEYLTLLLDHPVFRDRIAALGIRYLVSVGGDTKEGEKEGGIWCGGGYGGAGCFGGIAWDRRSNLGASILDLKEARRAGEVHAAISGRPWIGIVGIFPIGLPSPTEGRGCFEIGEGVAKFLRGENPPEE